MTFSENLNSSLNDYGPASSSKDLPKVVLGRIKGRSPMKRITPNSESLYTTSEETMGLSPRQGFLFSVANIIGAALKGELILFNLPIDVSRLFLPYKLLGRK